jgi:hypothetical protein
MRIFQIAIDKTLKRGHKERGNPILKLRVEIKPPESSPLHVKNLGHVKNIGIPEIFFEHQCSMLNKQKATP